MSNEVKRRDFIGMALGGVAAVGLGASLFAMKRTWDPLPSVVAAGFTTIDLSGMNPGEKKGFEWRGKPIYVIKKSDNMKDCSNRLIKTAEGDFYMGVQICTHLGCIPSYHQKEEIFKCACHGGEFDACGVNIFGPPPTPMVIPPFKVDGAKLVLGEEGPEYKQMQSAKA
jgi:ubiquinol-cytochrome c reductase iron-sulfur subunit